MTPELWSITCEISAVLAQMDPVPEAPVIDPEQKREIAETGINTAVKIIIVLLLFFVMAAMRSLNRKRLERSRSRRVKPWEIPPKK